MAESHFRETAWHGLKLEKPRLFERVISRGFDSPVTPTLQKINQGEIRRLRSRKSQFAAVGVSRTQRKAS